MNAGTEPTNEKADLSAEPPPPHAAVQSAAERWLLRALPLVIFFCLASAALLFWWNDVEAGQEDDWREFQRHTALVAGQITSRLEEHYRMHLRALERVQHAWAGAYANNERGFRQEAVILCGVYPAVGALGWADPDYVLRWLEPADPAAPPVDFKTQPERWMEMRTALTARRPAVSTVHPSTRGEPGALLILPLTENDQCLGFLLGALRMPQFLDECLMDRASGQFHIALFDADRAIYQRGKIVEGEFPHSAPIVERRVDIGGRVWALRLQARAGYFVPVQPWTESFLVWAGLSVSGIMAVMTWMLQARTKRLADQHDLLQESDTRLRERVRSLRLLNELGALLRQAPDLNLICAATLSKLRDAFGFDVLLFYRFDPQEQKLKLQAHHGVPPEMLADVQTQTLGTRFAGRAAQTGEIVVVEDLAADPRENRASIKQAHLHYTVYAPVKHSDKVLGLLALSYRSQRHLPPSGPELLTAIADAVGVAASNAQHFEQLRSSREFFQSLFDSATEAVFVETLDGRLLMANPRACQLLGYTADELVGRPSSDLFTPEDRHQILPRTDDRLQKDRELLFEANYQTKDGAPVAVEISTRRVRVGLQDLVITFSRDLTVRRRLEQELLQAQTMESIGTLAGGIAHDFNNQLSGILGFGSLALNSMKPGDPHYSEVLQMVSAAERAATFVQQLLTLGRKSPPKPHPINLNEVVDQVVHLLRHSLAESVEVRVEKALHLPATNADPVQWEQVLMNLCLNARDAVLQTPRRGVITIQTLAEDITPAPGRATHACPPGRYVVVTVADNGCGMDAVTRQRLFEPFFTTKRGGRNVGLGLAMVFNTVKGHQGHIEVESEPGVGSCFRIWLPVIEGPAQPVVPENADAPRGEETILLVDDDLSVLELTRTMLERNGYTVVTARDAIEGLELYKQNCGKIHMVITDLIMPKVNGGEFIAQLRQITPKLKIMVSTGYSADATALTKSDQRPQAVIQKPFKMAELARITRQVLDGTAPPFAVASPPS
ncbi:MAG: PAS domain S-box protein [Verrucomicrobia bacterium]|nr:PAS domain S-box protein [Verrucomicrobiota bacterium]